MAALPTGTVTFVFTDVERSTRLLRELGPDAYAATLGEHRKIVRAAFAKGVEVDTQGDAFFFAFPRAVDALTACETVLSVLDGGPIRLRIGVHTGEPLLTEEGYVGIDVHRAARIAAVGHGAQVLVSRTTRELVPEVAMRDLGEHRLKDLMRPEHLYQLGDREFPPLRSLGLTNLPAQPTPLIGREPEVAAATDAIRSGARLVTFTGPGGSGKTRLALQVAAELADYFPDGVWFASLATIAEATLIRGAVAGALGIDDDLASWLHGRKLLLVLDNVEHLLPDAAEVIATLLAPAGIRAIATSRERLAIAAEQELTVEPLPVDEGVALFVARARQLGVRIAPGHAVEAVVRAVDGLPLAIELAAGRVKVLSVEEILDRLRFPLDLLRGGPRDAPARQQTLRATIEWSVATLQEDERSVFTRLGVFQSSFDLDAADYVAGVDIDVLGSLIDKSLVRRTEEGRFFLLDTLWQDAHERFAICVDREEVERRHAEFFARRAQPRDAESQAGWRRRLQREYSDVRAALGFLREQAEPAPFVELVVALRRLWDPASVTEGRKWLEAALARIDDRRSRDACSVIGCLAHVAFRQGDWEAAARWGDEAIAIALETGDDATVIFQGYVRATVAYFRGDLAAARTGLEEALALARERGDRLNTAIGANDLALLSLQDGAVREGFALARECLETARALEQPVLESNAMVTLSLLEIAEGHFAEAETLVLGAIRIQRRSQAAPMQLAEGLVILALLTATTRSAALAGGLLGASDAYYESSGIVIEPYIADLRKEAREAVERRLGPRGAHAALRDGAFLTLEDAADGALQRLTPTAR